MRTNIKKKKGDQRIYQAGLRRDVWKLIVESFEQSGMTKRELAEEIGYSLNMVTKVITGTTSKITLEVFSDFIRGMGGRPMISLAKRVNSSDLDIPSVPLEVFLNEGKIR